MTRAMAQAPVTGTAARTAVALLARQALAPDVPREDLLGDVPADSVLEALEAITAGIIRGVWRADHGADLLDRLGIEIARLGGD
jgi:hypothetical protein